MIETLGKSNNHPCPKCHKKSMDWLHDLEGGRHYLYCEDCKLTTEALYGDIE